MAAAPLILNVGACWSSLKLSSVSVHLLSSSGTVNLGAVPHKSQVGPVTPDACQLAEQATMLLPIGQQEKCFLSHLSRSGAWKGVLLPHTSVADLEALIFARGVSFKLDNAACHRPVLLPTYAFDRASFPLPRVRRTSASSDGVSVTGPPVRCYIDDWVPIASSVASGIPRSFLIATDNGELRERVRVALREQGHIVVEHDLISPWDECLSVHTDLLLDLSIHSTCLRELMGGDFSQVFERSLQFSFNVMKRVALLDTQILQQLRIWVLTRDCMKHADDSSLDPFAAHLSGLIKSLTLEISGIEMNHIDTTSDIGISRLAAILCQQISRERGESLVLLRRDACYARRVREVNMPPISTSPHNLPISSGTTVLTGGTGGLGSLILKWLARGSESVGHILVVGRSLQNRSKEQFQQLMDLYNIHIHFLKLDVAHPEFPKLVCGELQALMWPSISSIYHLAGFVKDKALRNCSWEEFRAPFSPKAVGAWNLHELSLEGEKPVPLILFSSSASFFGSPMQANYSAANSFLDGLCWYRHSLGLQSASINWGPWLEAGIFARLGQVLQQRIRKSGFYPLPSKPCFSILERSLSFDVPVFAVAAIDVSAMIEQFFDGDCPLAIASLAKLETASPSSLENTAVARAVLDALSVKVSPTNARVSLWDLGLDSLTVVLLQTALEGMLEVKIPLQVFYEHITVLDLIDFFKQIAQRQTGNKCVDEASMIYSDVCLPSECYARGPTVQNPPVVGTALLTGATGFVGGHLLQELLRETEYDILCLVRAESPTHGKARIARNAAKLGLPVFANSRVQVVVGDLNERRFGLTGKSFTALAKLVVVVYHCAARVDLSLSYAALRQANVSGTKHVLELASLRTKSAMWVHYISTYGVFSQSETRTVLEDMPLHSPMVLPNGYSKTKWVGEQVVSIAQKRGIPICVFRLGQMTGSLFKGVQNLDDIFSRMWKGCLQLHCWPQLHHLEVTPVDYASSAIAKLSKSPRNGAVFHLVNPSTLSASKLFQFIKDVTVHDLRVLPQNEWLALVTDEPGNALHPILPMLRCLIDSNLLGNPLEFDTRNVTKGLRDMDCVCPAIDEELLRTYLTFYLQAGFIDRDLIKP
jgi:5-hydroxydodecatetraenal polyketide synthase CpkC